MTKSNPKKINLATKCTFSPLPLSSIIFPKMACKLTCSVHVHLNLKNPPRTAPLTNRQETEDSQRVHMHNWKWDQQMHVTCNLLSTVVDSNSIWKATRILKDEPQNLPLLPSNYTSVTCNYKKNTLLRMSQGYNELLKMNSSMCNAYVQLEMLLCQILAIHSQFVAGSCRVD